MAAAAGWQARVGARRPRRGWPVLCCHVFAAGDATARRWRRGAKKTFPTAGAEAGGEEGRCSQETHRCAANPVWRGQEGVAGADPILWPPFTGRPAHPSRRPSPPPHQPRRRTPPHPLPRPAAAPAADAVAADATARLAELEAKFARDRGRIDQVPDVQRLIQVTGTRALVSWEGLSHLAGNMQLADVDSVARGGCYLGFGTASPLHPRTQDPGPPHPNRPAWGLPRGERDGAAPAGQLLRVRRCVTPLPLRSRRRAAPLPARVPAAAPCRCARAPLLPHPGAITTGARLHDFQLLARDGGRQAAPPCAGTMAPGRKASSAPLLACARRNP